MEKDYFISHKVKLLFKKIEVKVQQKTKKKKAGEQCDRQMLNIFNIQSI